jgi:peptidase M48-like protein
MSPRSLHGQGVSAAFIALTFLSPAHAQVSGVPDAGVVARMPQLGTVGARAFQYFAPTRQRSWGDYLKSIRPAAVSADSKARALSMVRKEDVIEPSAERQAKLDALRPVLEYLERDVAIEVKILRLELAWAGLLGGAAVLVSEGAVDLLTAEELQAVVAHELAHEYFADEYEAARSGKRYDTVREIELRCDAVSIVTMRGLRLDPGALLSAVAKLTKFNHRRGFPNSPTLAPSMEERRSFTRAVAELVQ